MEITIQVRAPELCAAMKDLADAMRQRYTAIQFPQPQPKAEAADPAPTEVSAAPAPAHRKRRTKAEMEADAAAVSRTKAEMEADAAAESANAASQAVSHTAEVTEVAPAVQAPLSVTPGAATTTSVSGPSTAPTASTAYPTPTDFASLKAVAVSHATDIEGGAEHVKFCLGTFSAATLSLLNPALYGQFAAALWKLRATKG